MTAPASTLLQRVTGWFGGLPGKAADVLPVRLGVTEYRQSSSTPASVLGFDQALLWVVVALLAWGLVVLIAADLVLALNEHWITVLAGVALWGVHMGMTQGLLATMVAARIAT